MQYSNTLTLSQMIDVLMEGDDLAAQGDIVKAAAREFLTMAALHFKEQGGAELVEMALPLSRRIVGHPDWHTRLDVSDFIRFCETKVVNYPTGEGAHQPGLDVQAEYLSACADEYLAQW